MANICFGGLCCGIVALMSSCNANAATTDAQYQAAIASARCCNIAGTISGVIGLIIIIIVVAVTASAASSYSYLHNNDDWY